ncbi:hypothetical protein PMAYCL1PPCAC_09734, partial [Pristionchus mayeri]
SMEALSLLLPLVFVSVIAEGQYRCDSDPMVQNYQPIGKYCYYIDEKHTTDSFDQQRATCKSLGGDLAGFETLEDQTQLLNNLIVKKGYNFNPFYIGLFCNRTIESWDWMNPDI